MAFTRKHGWRDLFQEMFVRQGYFSLRPPPISKAEEAESAARESAESTAKIRHDKNLTRLNLDLESTPPD